VQALAAAGRPRAVLTLRRARAFLRSTQRPDGGWALRLGQASDPLATSWVAIALSAMRERADAKPWSRGGGPLAWLRAHLGPDGGPTDGADGRPVWVAAQVALALSGRSLPIMGPRAGSPVDRVPLVVAHDPADGEPVAGPLIVRYRDDAGGTGVDPASVRIRVRGRDRTALATVSPFGLQLPASAVPRGRAMIEVTVADRAGNRRTVRWSVVGAAPESTR
jgi:hypothetical protein